jgi:hypothetical protein
VSLGHALATHQHSLVDLGNMRRDTSVPVLARQHTGSGA